jgi:hypothetical protein
LSEATLVQPLVAGYLKLFDAEAAIVSAAAHFRAAEWRRADDKFGRSDPGLATMRWVHAGTASPRRRYSVTDRAAGSWPCCGFSGLAFTAAVGVLAGSGDMSCSRCLWLTAREEP